MAEPIKITLYDPETSEPISTFSRSIVPFGLLRQAVKMQKSLHQAAGAVDDETCTALADLVVKFFGSQFTRDEFETGCELSEGIAVVNAIIARANPK